MFKTTLTLGALLLASSALANETPIVGNVESKCSIYTDTVGVYGNPTPSTLSTVAADGGVMPVVRFDVATAAVYTAKISSPLEFSQSPSLIDAVVWTGNTEVSNTSDAGMSGYEAAKVQYDNHTTFDLTVAGSVWFKVTSTVAYGVAKPLPGGVYKANIIAECIAN
jgi:hypothetical protein|tara:strand:+ start:393 stop:890 length:498 start_codon:yes stop_codon:yes gene_type:complete